MINLIPPHAKKEVAHEYWIRVISVWGFLLSTVMAVVLALLFPSYVSPTLQLKAVEAEMVQGDTTQDGFESVNDVVRAANVVVEQLDMPRVQVEMSEIIAEILRVAGPGIDFKTFAITREIKEIDSISIQGKALTRATLADFRDQLERSALFGSASIPISDLAKEADLPFSIAITLSNIRDGHDN